MEGAVQRAQLPVQDPERPAVSNDVVGCDEQAVVRIRQPEQRDPQQRALLQVERCVDALLQTPLAFVGRPAVATDVGAVSEQVGGFGEVVPPRDPAALRDALTSVLDPVVEYRTWPIARVPFSRSRSVAENTCDTSPMSTCLANGVFGPVAVTIPALSCPRCWSAKSP